MQVLELKKNKPATTTTPPAVINTTLTTREIYKRFDLIIRFWVYLHYFLTVVDVVVSHFIRLIYLNIRNRNSKKNPRGIKFLS